MAPGIIVSRGFYKSLSGAFTFFFLLTFSSKLFSQVPRDTIFFKNGSVIVGKIKKVKLGVVTFDPADANDVTVKLNRLRTMAAVRKVYRIETVKNQRYYGKLLPATDTNYVIVSPGSDSTRLYLEDISVMTPYGNKILQRLSGSFEVGYTYTRSSNFGRLNYDVNLVYTTRKDEISLSASGIYSMTDSSFTNDNENISLKYNYYFTPTWFTTVMAAYQHNLELGLERRFQEGFGIGNKFLTKRTVYAWSRTGIMFNQEKSTLDVTTGTLAELFTQLQFSFFKLSKPAFTFDIAQTFYYNLSQDGRFRNDGETSLSWDIISDMKLTFSLYNNFDSKPPVEGNRKFDFGINFGVKYVF